MSSTEPGSELINETNDNEAIEQDKDRKRGSADPEIIALRSIMHHHHHH